jgi:hypothetical protein
MPEKKETIDPYAILGVGDKKAEAMNKELDILVRELHYSDKVLTALAKRYDPKSLIMGMYLGSKIMKAEGWSPP